MVTDEGSQPDLSGSLTAYVIMRPADPTQNLSEPITSQNIGAMQPAPEAVQQVSTMCAARGFDVGPFVGISFAITGPPELFSSSFNLADGGGLQLDDADPAVTALIETVVMDEPAQLFDALNEQSLDEQSLDEQNAGQDDAQAPTDDPNEPAPEDPPSDGLF